MRFAVVRAYIWLLLAVWSVFLLAIVIVRIVGGINPTTSLLAWVSEREGNREIYLLDLATTYWINISHSPESDSYPVWSADGRLAWSAYRDGNEEIYVWDGISGEVTNVSQNSAQDYAPAWSPDGRLAWTSHRDHNAEIYVWDGISGEVSNVSRSWTTDQFPVWSSDGRLAWQSRGAGNSEIYVFDTASGEFDYEREETVELAPAQILLVEFNAQAGGLVFRR